MKNRFIFILFVMATALTVYKTLDSNVVSCNASNSQATQVYYTDKVFADGFGGWFVNFGYRTKVTLEEISEKSVRNEEKDNFQLYTSISNTSSISFVRDLTYTMSTASKMSIKLASDESIIKAEIGSEFSTNQTYTDRVSVTVPGHTTVDIYTYNVKMSIHNVVEKKEAEHRVLWFWIPTGEISSIESGITIYSKFPGIQLVER